MSRKTLLVLTIAVTIVAVIAIVGWGNSTNWTFKKSA